MSIPPEKERPCTADNLQDILDRKEYSREKETTVYKLLSLYLLKLDVLQFTQFTNDYVNTLQKMLDGERRPMTKDELVCISYDCELILRIMSKDLEDRNVFSFIVSAIDSFLKA